MTLQIFNSGTKRVPYNLPRARKKIIMNYVLIRHKVADLAKWKPAYDAHGSARAIAGLKEERLLRNIDNPNEVVLLFSAQDLNNAIQFVVSDDLCQRMQQVGVTDRTDIWF